MATKAKNRNTGFTFVEIFITVLIIAILAAITVPSYLRTAEITRMKQAMITLEKIAKAQKSYQVRQGGYSPILSPLSLDLTNIDGKTLKGASFSDNYFDYQIFGDDFEKAKATRNTGEYELSVFYSTGEILCRPIANHICKYLEVNEDAKFLSLSKFLK